MTDKTETDIIDEIDADKEAENLEVALNRIALQKNLAKRKKQQTMIEEKKLTKGLKNG